MTLDELTSKLGIKFPKKFSEIYETGAMEWLEYSFEDFRTVRDRYINDPKSFMMIHGEFEPLMFSEIPERAEELAEWLSWRAEDTGETLREGVKLIPIAQTGGGDLHLLVFDGETEPKVIQYQHDDYDKPVLWGRNFDECLYYALLESLQWSDSPNEDINGAVWQYQLNYLSGEYRAKIEGKTVEELMNDFKALGSELDKVELEIFEVK